MRTYPGHVMPMQAHHPVRKRRGVRLPSFVLALVLALVAGLLLVPKAYAEGSSDLTENGGYRAYTERYGAETAGVKRQSVMKVYLEEGETLYLGSSVSTAQLRKTIGGDFLFDNTSMGTSFSDDQLNFLNDADICICAPGWDASNNPDAEPYVNGQRDASVTFIDIPDSASASTAGYISDHAQEAAGPADHAAGGYACAAESAVTSPAGVAADVKYEGNTFTAGQSGIYTIAFYSTEYGTTDPVPALVTEAWDQKNSTIAAWDLSVYAADGSLKTGRVFTDALFLNMGTNKTGTDMLKAKVYPVTKDGYQYEVNFNGMDPYGLRFTCNNRGLLNTQYTSAGTSLFHSVESDNNQLSDLANHYVALSGTSTSSLDQSYWIFYNEPDAEALTALGIPTSPTSGVGSISNFEFTGSGDATENEGYVGYGGTFSFDASSDTSATSYQIELNFGTDNTVTLSNALVKGTTNSITWDGKDAKGNVVSAGTYDTSNVTVKLKGGEIHFPLLDVENNQNGIIVNRLNGEGTTDQKATVYYNDSASNAGDATSPWTVDKNWTVADKVDATSGVVSTSGTALKYTNMVGDKTALDVWAYYDRSVSLGTYNFKLVDTTTVTQAVPPITKSFFTATERPSDKTFTFDLTASASNPAGAILPTPATATITDTGTNKTPFGDITFTAAGTYTFYISEEYSGETGYGYDTSVFVYTVTTALDSATNSLEVTSTSLAVKTDMDTPDSSAVPVNQILFLNTYTPESVDAASIGVKKTVLGSPTSDETFTYALIPSGDNPTDGVTGLATTAQTTGAGSLENAFGTATFTKAGTYTFTCFEYAGMSDGWTYDGDSYTWTVVIEDVGGQLTVKSNTLVQGQTSIDDGVAVFENTYAAPSNPYLVPGVTKVVEGETPSDGTFTFTIAADTAGAPLPADTTITVTGNGTASFGSIEYVNPGIYVYKISEELGSITGYSYDQSVYTLRVTVASVGNKLVPTGTVTTADGTEADTMLFTNDYEPDITTQVSPDVRKILDGTPSEASSFLVALF
ncbi:MAG: FctA domain-containing protein, partial [Atopobiaceae bacterium]|nr:FctA domain-containing protein [Atopobiaceae bacterium]